MNINFELFKIFYAVANNGSISKGAEELMISQPAVTQSIQSLENQLGGQLFIRTKKGVLLTNEGNVLYNYIKEGMIYFNNGINKFMSLKNLDSGIIRIGASTSITEQFLMPYISTFHNLYPNVDIKIINNLTDNLLKDLKNGNLDIVISSFYNNDNKDLEFNIIKEINDIFVSNKKIKLNKDELFKQNLIIQTKPSVTRKNFDNFVKQNNLNFKPYMEVVSHRLVVEFVKNGFGIGLATKEFLYNELNTEIFEINTDFRIPKRKIAYITIKNNIPTYSTQKFIDIIKTTNK